MQAEIAILKNHCSELERQLKLTELASVLGTSQSSELVKDQRLTEAYTQIETLRSQLLLAQG